jgi:c(7)-type cytochrome triheme protein
MRWRREATRGRRCVGIGVAAGAATLTITLLAGCSPETRQKVLPYFFDGFSSEAPGPRPPTRRARRDLVGEIDTLKRELADARATAKAVEAPAEVKRPAERVSDWDKLVELMPKDGAGRVDWVQGLKSGTIAPRPSPDPQAPAQAVLDLDVELSDAGSKLFRAVYPHAPHTAWLACGNCHPAIFPIGRKAAPTKITMQKIRAGEQCGVCHGKVSFAVDGGCPRCHRAVPAVSQWRRGEEPRAPMEQATGWTEAAKLLPATLGTPDWVKAIGAGLAKPRPSVDPTVADTPPFPLDVELVPNGMAPFKVRFPHAAHTTWLTCANCHPAIFQMAKGADPITMEKVFAGEYCGRCHGKVAFALTACGRCHPVMAGGQ